MPQITEIKPVSFVKGFLENLFNSKTEDPYSLLLHNDDSVYYGTVLEALTTTIPNIDKTKAHAIMLKAHRDGKACIVTCGKSEAEEYMRKLKAFGLTISIEKRD